MPETGNAVIQFMQVLAPIAGTALTTLGGIAIAKIGSNNSKELSNLSDRIQNLQTTANQITGVRKELVELKESSRSGRRYILYRDLDLAIERGWTSLEERREMAKLFDSYKILGGNGEIETMYEIYRNLPLKEV